MEEEWVIIKGFENYKISNLGNVLNKHGRLVKSHAHDNVYDGKRVRLYKAPKKRFGLLVKRLIAENFIGEIKDREVVILDVYKAVTLDNIAIRRKLSK